MRTRSALLATLLLAACSPWAPDQAHPIPPPDPALWHAVEDCSGIQGNMARVTWLEVPADLPNGAFSCPAHPRGCGGWWRPPHTIYVVGPSWVHPTGGYEDTAAVKHEMLHDLLQTGDHPPIFRKCGRVNSP